MKLYAKQLVIKYIPFVQSFVDLRTKFRRLIALEQRVVLLEKKVLAPRIAKLLNLLQPMKPEGVDLIRIGNEGDGGYVMVDALDNIEAAYSLGIADDVSWDKAIAEKNIPVFMYDPTITRPPEKNINFNFEKIGITGSPEREPSMKDLSTLFVENGHSNSNNLVLKIDIEGYEWDVFDKINVEDLKRFTQIVCEFHRMDQLAWVDKIDVFERVIQKLSLYFNVIHMHANNVGWLVDVDYVKVPVLLEISFVRNDLVKKFDIINTLRSDLDYENNPDASALDISNLWQQELKND